MGSRGSPNPWPPYPGYRDCSQEICSIYCPQWCYIIFPPPPPSYSPEDDDSGSNFSPLIIAVIGILSSAFLLIAYYTLISKYCKRRTSQNLISDIESNQGQVNHDIFQATNHSGLADSIIKSIAVCKYKVGDGLVEGTECSVCLSDFVENERLRLLPKCNHAFHLPCIDTWLKSHSNCPMCRASVVAASTSSDNSPTDQIRQTQSDGDRSALSISSLQVQRQHDLVVVEQRDEVVVDIIRDPNDQTQQVMRRSSSTGSFSRQQRQLCVADILEIDEDEEEVVNKNVLPKGIGTSRGGNESVEMKRSVSTGKL